MAETLLDQYGVMDVIAMLHSTAIPKALKVSHETWRNLINAVPTMEATSYTRLYGIPVEFDESIPVNKYRPVYSDN